MPTAGDRRGASAMAQSVLGGGDEDAVQHAVGAIKILMKRTERLHGGSRPIDHGSVDAIARKVIAEDVSDDLEVFSVTPRSPISRSSARVTKKKTANAADKTFNSASFMRSGSASSSRSRPRSRSHSKSPHSLRLSSSQQFRNTLPRYLDSTPISTKRSPTKRDGAPGNSRRSRPLENSFTSPAMNKSWARRTSHNAMRSRQFDQAKAVPKFAPPARKIADPKIVNGIVDRLHKSNADKFQKREAAKKAQEEQEVKMCQPKPYVNPRSIEIAGQMEHIATRSKKVIKSKQAALNRLKARADREKQSELRDPKINERSRQLMRQREDLVEWEKNRDRKLEEKRKTAKIDPNCTFKPVICEKSDKVARTIHERGSHPGDRMYREHTQLSMKRERERQRAEQEKEAQAEKHFFRPQISKGSQMLARERSRERPVFERLWSPSRTKMKNNTYASSFSQTPDRGANSSFDHGAHSTPGKLDVMSFDNFRNRRPSTEERPRERPRTMYAHRHRDRDHRRTSTTPEHLSRGPGGHKVSRGTDPLPQAEATEPTVVAYDSRFEDILEKVMGLNTVENESTRNSAVEGAIASELSSESANSVDKTNKFPRNFIPFAHGVDQVDERS